MPAGALLTVNEVAELEGLSYRGVHQRIKRNHLQIVKLDASDKKGHGYEFRIALDQLSERAQRAYYGRKAAPKPEASSAPSIRPAPPGLLDLTEEQRMEINFWMQVIREYNAFIADSPGNTTAKTKEFVALLQERHPDRALSERTLRRKLKDYRDVGETGLADFRRQSKAKGTSTIHEVVESAFLQYWLTEARPAVTACRTLVEQMLWLEADDKPELESFLPLPDVQAFYRLAKNVPYPVLQYFRHGRKEFEDKCAPYLQRMYEQLASNEVWSADYHTLDFFVRCDTTGKVFRPHLIAWLDIRSRKFLAIGLEDSSNSQGNCIAFRKAVARFGIPESVYLDNGREFLVSDFGGRGRRKTDKNADYGSTILQRLGVTMHNAMAGNAKAKAIERAFKEVCNEFSKFVATYCGGSPADRPEALDAILKDKNKIPLLSQVNARLEAYIEGWRNERNSQAKGLKGQSPNDCYAANLSMVRTATKEQLNLMLLRNERLQTVQREGVYITLHGEKQYFYDTGLVNAYMTHKVYVRYNPEDLRSVHVYDDQERYICEAAATPMGGYDFEGETTTEAIKDLSRRKRAQKKIVSEFLRHHQSIIKVPEAMEVIDRVADERIAQRQDPSPAIIAPIFHSDKKAVGYGDEAEVEIDVARMVRNAAKRKGIEV